MPGSFATAAPTTVLPFSLCRSFVHSREYAVQVNEYRNGESQRSRLADASRKRWRLGKRLTAAELAALRDGYVARTGPQNPFWFYVPPFVDDPTGIASAGRYAVRFESEWYQTTDANRSVCELEVVEIV